MIPKIESIRIRDRLLTNMLYHISQSKALSDNLILQGGGALHFIYSSPRYSNDLDFVVPDLSFHKSDIINDLMKIPYNLHESISYESRVAKDSGNYIRISYDSPRQTNDPSVHVEILGQTAEEYKIASGKYSPLLVETPSEIYADKIVGTLSRMMTRGSLKSTDLFDLDFIIKNFQNPPNEERIERKANTYKYCGWTRKNVESVIDFIFDKSNHPQFRKDIKKTLLPEVYEYMILDSNFFEKSILHFEPLRKI